MFGLRTFSLDECSDISSGSLLTVEATRLFFLHDGRNAWHSTWVQKYYEGCLHTSLFAAQMSALRKRVQGSRFYIEEVPAVLIRADAGCLAITQINSPNPLASYLLRVKQSSVDLRGMSLSDGDDRNYYLAPGSPILGLAKSFDLSSGFWSPCHNSDDDTQIVASDDPTEAFSKLGGSKLRRWVSSSYGGGSPLGWLEEDSRDKISGNGVARIVRSAERSVVATLKKMSPRKAAQISLQRSLMTRNLAVN